MSTPERADDEYKDHDLSMMMKSILESFVIYKENQVVCDRKVSHYLRSSWVQVLKKVKQFKKFLNSKDECRRQILSGLLCVLSFLGPFVASFEFGPRTLSV